MLTHKHNTLVKIYRNLGYVTLVIILLFPALVFGQEGSAGTWKYKLFTGTWKFNANSVDLTHKPDRQVLQNGRFQCSTCVPKLDVKADGTDQPVSGSDDFDAVVVKPLNDHSARFTNKKNGKIVEEFTETVSPDGKVMTVQGKAFSPNGDVITYSVTNLRVQDAPPGANLVSGAWRVSKTEQSDNSLIVHYKASPDGFAMTWPTGYSYDAKFDGKEYPIHGEPGTMVSLKKISDRAFGETVIEHGKVVRVYKITVSSDGKTLNIRENDKQDGRTWLISAQKQQ